MISLHDLYTVLSAVIPLYVAMILAYGSVRWWKILTPEQCSGINRFVAVFAVPLLSFHFIASNNPYHMNAKYIVADVVQKLVVLLALTLWAWFSSAGSLEWLITIFMLATLPNTLVMGIPLLQSMYGGHADTLMVQFVVMQSIIWYTILLFLYEYRAAKVLIMAQFPDGTAASIVDFRVDSDVHSIDGREAIDTDSQVREDGTIVVNVRRSVSSRSDTVTPRTSMHMRSMPSSKALTPRPSNLSGIDIYSMHSSVNLTPRESNFTHAEFFSMTAGPGGRLHSTSSPRQSNFNSSDAYSLHSSRAPTPRTSNANEDICNHPKASVHPSSHSPRYPAALYAPGPNSLLGRGLVCGAAPAFDGSSPANGAQAARKSSAAAALVSEPRLSCASPKLEPRMEQDGRELHMFVWSAAASPASEAGLHVFGDENGRHDVEQPKEVHLLVKSSPDPYAAATLTAGAGAGIGPDFSFGSRPHLFIDESLDMANNSKHGPSSIVAATSKILESTPPVMPAPKVMAKLIFTMAWKKLIRNPNTYASLIGIVWSLIAFKFHIKMPAIVENSVTILSDAGLGMAMFSLGLFMALQKRIIVCGPQLAAFGMVVRFLTGPAVMAAASIAVGLRGRELHIAIVQAALPQGIVPFVFAKEYDLHPDILSTAVIFGMLIALPITLVYYVAMGI